MSAGAALTAQAFVPRAASGSDHDTKAVLFDAFAIFDPRPIGVLARELTGEHGAELMGLWRRKQFEYTWLLNSAQRYESFWQVTQEALAFSARELSMDLSESAQARLMQAYLQIAPWPDVATGLTTLRAAGLRLGLLSNFTEEMLQRALSNAPELTFDTVLSTDRARRFKPDPRAYAMGTEALGLGRSSILFVAFAGWDAVGSKWFGYKTFWLNRMRAAPEQLGAEADSSGSSFDELVRFARR